MSLADIADLWDLDSDRYAWRAYGACRRHPEVNFFPARGESTREAEAICAACPVRAICLEVAIANGEKFGIWGGLSGRERRRLRRQRNRTTPTEGATP